MEYISVQELKAKARSKNEIYRLLATDGKDSAAILTSALRRHLPPSEEALHRGLHQTGLQWREEGKALDAGLNLHKHILNPDVKRIDVPHYKGLSLADILTEFPRPHDIYDSGRP